MTNRNKFRIRVEQDRSLTGGVLMSYDHWKTTNPDDEFLGPGPEEEPEPEYDAEDDGRKSYEEALRAIRERKAKGGPGWPRDNN